MGKTLDQLRETLDPTFVIQSPTQIYSRELRSDVTRYIITSAQNGTPVDVDFWAILCGIATRLSAEILVIPLRYKNPTSNWSGSQQNAEWWASEVRPYLWNAPKDLNSNLRLMANIKIQPTASSPLAGTEGISHSSSGILGHPKIQTRTIATPQNRMPKLLMTSGSVTVANYSDSRAGRLGDFHHSLSAVLVEISGSRFHVRRLHFDAATQSVTDLGTRHFADRQEAAPPALALVMGDTHVRFIDPAVERATFGPAGLIEVCRPQHVVYHDVLDSYSVNGHHLGNPLIAVAKRKGGADNARAEVEEAIDFVRQRTSKNHRAVIVGSNHDDMLTRWILNHDWKEDPVNAAFYLETAAAMVASAKLGPTGTEYPAAFPYWFDKARVPYARCLKTDESFVLADVEMGFHFDKGPSGSRGSIRNMRRIGTKTIGGHSHSPGEDEGAVQVGTSTRLTAEYVRGPSAWLNAHCSLNADGKRQLVTIVDGEFRVRP